MGELESQAASAPRVPLGGDYWDADPEAPLWGFADLHAHLMAHLAFGGNAFWGLPYDPDHPGPEGMQYALPSCAPIHGGLINVNPEFGHPAGGGWPDFIIWPRFTTLSHQQAYIDWLYRAFEGGLRLITCIAVNNELLATKSNPRLPIDDRSAIQRQVSAMKAMVEHVDRKSGGSGRGWLQIAFSAEDARRIIGENKLAVVLGVEVDSLGNWRKVGDLDEACHGDLAQARVLIGDELDWLHSLGVRQITPIHLTNNAFGGTAIYLRILEISNLFITGERWTVEDAWQTGVRYRIDHDGEDLVDEAERTVIIQGVRHRAMHRRALIDYIPGVRTLVDALDAPRIRGGHANTRGLNAYGIILLQEMMRRGLIIDVDHMSEKSTDTALELAESAQYPVITSHSWFRDLLYSSTDEFDPRKPISDYDTSDVHKVAHEAGKRGDQIARIARLGGVVAAILNQGDIAGLSKVLPDIADKVPIPNAGSSTSWAQAYLYAVAKTGGRGVAMGSDINGAAGLPGPRFGTYAAFGTHRDARRERHRSSEIDNQTNGVAYSEPIRDYRWYRFEHSGPGGYDRECCDVWHAMAQHAAGFNPTIHKHPPTDHPETSFRDLREDAIFRLDRRWIDNVTIGLWMADQQPHRDKHQIAGWPHEQRAAYLARLEGPLDNEEGVDPYKRPLVDKIRAILGRWQHMTGDNRPLARSFAGERRDFDINIDGMAHYGMLPDLLQDVRNIGLTAEDLAPLFRSAYDYVQMWAKCESTAEKLISSAKALQITGGA